MMQTGDAITWFEIPVRDLNRAVTFYTTILGIDLQVTNLMGVPHALFPVTETGVSGALTQRRDVKPAEHGTRVYLRVDGDINNALSKVEHAGVASSRRRRRSARRGSTA
ncbi:VOC family protein [Haladaptatus sp. GCM10025707]|uniref:VOC family protein n=1 Tax=unclassified Haladaptatus TaxID=2622732 RepID=UPI00360F25CC